MFETPELQGRLVDYASAMIFEVHQDNSLQVYFRNGSYGTLDQHNVLGSSSLTVNRFMSHFDPIKLTRWQTGATRAVRPMLADVLH